MPKIIILNANSAPIATPDAETIALSPRKVTTKVSAYDMIVAVADKSIGGVILTAMAQENLLCWDMTERLEKQKDSHMFLIECDDINRVRDILKRA